MDQRQWIRNIYFCHQDKKQACVGNLPDQYDPRHSNILTDQSYWELSHSAESFLQQRQALPLSQNGFQQSTHCSSSGHFGSAPVQGWSTPKPLLELPTGKAETRKGRGQGGVMVWRLWEGRSSAKGGSYPLQQQSPCPLSLLELHVAKLLHRSEKTHCRLGHLHRGKICWSIILHTHTLSLLQHTSFWCCCTNYGGRIN